MVQRLAGSVPADVITVCSFEQAAIAQPIVAV
jgi:hypothetical protein